ncbi:MAG: cytochrome b/b6 domain-containing protein [Gammaproteobacteria bacterium]|jgi:cytochrome b561|nr:cytochrome b/b6 domain-containing protein [Gammaproteobacteria bacterium]
MRNSRSLLDTQNSFGWFSIGMHWFAALAIILLWFVGQSISLQSVEQIDARRSLHITLGLIAWLPLVMRMVWRYKSGHPHVNGQTLLTHRLAKAVHHLMLLVLVVMLISGPLMAWAMPDRSSLSEFAFIFHSNAAKALALLVVLHVLAALKHLMFHEDETVARIFVPRKDDAKDEG